MRGKLPLIKNVILSIAFELLRKMHTAKYLINIFRVNWRDSSSRENEIQNDGFGFGHARTGPAMLEFIATKKR